MREPASTTTDCGKDVNTRERDYLLDLEHRQAKSSANFSTFNKFHVAMTLILDKTVLWEGVLARRSLPLRARCAKVALIYAADRVLAIKTREVTRAEVRRPVRSAGHNAR